MKGALFAMKHSKVKKERMNRRELIEIIGLSLALLALGLFVVWFRGHVAKTSPSDLPAPWPSEAYMSADHLLGKPLSMQSSGLGFVEIPLATLGLAGRNSSVALIDAYAKVDPAEYVWVDFDPIVTISEDPYLGSQWHLANIQAYDAWEITRGEGAKIGVVDTGIDAAHEDLIGKVVAERDYVENDNRAQDEHGHGTHVSGIAAAWLGNGVGGAGVCPQCQLLVCRALNARGQGSASNVSRCIVWAAGGGADVINLSLGSAQRSSAMQDAVRSAVAQGAVVVAAAGNSSSSIPQYPGAYPEVVSVAATDSNDRPASFTTRGAWVDVSAPGVNILSTVPGGYTRMSGTSMASPVVSGIFGLVSALHPQWSVLQKRDAVESGVTPVQGNNGGMGSGVVNALLAVSEEGEPPAPVPSVRPSPTRIPPTPAGDQARQTIQLINDYRESRGLPRLPEDTRLDQAAEWQSKDMNDNRFCGHFGTDGSNPFDRMRRAGYPLRTGGEIVACGYTSPADAVQGWIHSPGHHAIIVSRTFSDIGCGVVGRYYTCDFGLQRGSTPNPTATPPSISPTATIPSAGKYCLACWDQAGKDTCLTISCPD
jgi:thermitase